MRNFHYYKKQTTVISIIVLATFIFQSCLKEIEFETDFNQDILVVDGILTNSDQPDIISLSFAVDYGTQVFTPFESATVRVYDSNGNSTLIQEIEPGRYQVDKMALQPQIGETYYLEIELENGKIYQSTPETMLPVPPIDSISFSISVEEFANDLGNIVDRNLFQMRAFTTINTENTTDFLRWDVEHVFAFEQPFLYYIPFHQAAICYVYQPLDPQVINVVDGRSFEGNTSVNAVVATKPMDYTFGFAQSYRLRQYSLSEETFEYWNNINKVSNQVGNIFDAPPAPITGNMSNINDTDEVVLGYFGVSAVSTKTLFVTKGDITPFYRPIAFCGIEPRSPREQLPPECVACATLDNVGARPDYW